MGRRSPPASTLSDARAYCARRERSQQEVRDKLYDWGQPKPQVEAIIAQLIGEGFLNETRFAEHFAVSKFRQKGWGRRKIEQALRLKQVSEPCIALGLKSIEEDEYRKALATAVAKHCEKVKEENAFIKRQKVMRYFIGKGYAAEQVERALEEIAD